MRSPLPCKASVVTLYCQGVCHTPCAVLVIEWCVSQLSNAMTKYSRKSTEKQVFFWFTVSITVAWTHGFGSVLRQNIKVRGGWEKEAVPLRVVKNQWREAAACISRYSLNDKLPSTKPRFPILLLHNSTHNLETSPSTQEPPASKDDRCTLFCGWKNWGPGVIRCSPAVTWPTHRRTRLQTHASRTLV